MTRFDFIGFVENYAEDLQTLSRVLSVPVVETRENINKYSGYEEEISAIKADRQLISTLYDYLMEDIKFYERIKVRRLG